MRSWILEVGYVKRPQLNQRRARAENRVNISRSPPAHTQPRLDGENEPMCSTSEPTVTTSIRIMGPQPPPPPTVPGDLGVEKPAQVCLKLFPSRMFNGGKRSFCSNWFKGREWLEYSLSADSAFCFPCRKFSSASLHSSRIF